MKILEELWYGNVLAEERSVGQDSKAHKLGGYILRHVEELMRCCLYKQKRYMKRFGRIGRNCTTSTSARPSASASGLAHGSHMK